MERQYAVLGPLPSGVETRAFLGCEMADGQPQPDHPVVVVWLPEEVTQDAKQVERLQRETAFVTELDHPGLLHIHGLECFEEGWARVLDFVDGEPLSRFVELARQDGGNIPVPVAVKIILDACDAVHFAHEKGRESMANRPLVHGAIRPDTLMLAFDGDTKVTGYGASVLSGTKDAERGEDAIAYMAPEQVIGGRSTVSPSSDVYALGATLYDLLSGKPPFEGAEDLEGAVLTGQLEKHEVEGHLGGLFAVAEKAMSKKGVDRYGSVLELRNAIFEAMEGEAIASTEEMASFANELIPGDRPERVQRATLLESTGDLDALTVLSRLDEVPEGVDPALFAASRPATETGRIRLRKNNADREATIATGDLPRRRSAPPRDEDTVLEEGAVRRPPDRERTVVERDATVRSQPPPPSIPVPAPATPSAPPAAAEPSPSSTQPGATLPGSIPPGAVPPGAVPPHGSMPPGPYGSMPPPGVMPPGAMPPGARAWPPGVMPPGGMPPGAYPSMPPPGYPVPPGMRPSQVPPGMRPSQFPPGMRPSQFPPGMRPSQAPPGMRPSQLPPGMNSSAPPGARTSHAPMRHVPLQGNYMGNNNEFLKEEDAARVSQPPPPASPDPFGQAGLQDAGRAPRATSEITSFDKDVGQSSRIWLIVGILGITIVLGLIMSMGKEVPEGLNAESERKRLPKELIQEALSHESAPEEQDPDATPEQPELVAPTPLDPKATPDGSVASEAKPAVTFGFLNLESEPNVDVYDGNTLLGRTPVRVRLKSGSYRIRFTDKDKLINRYKRYRVRPDGDHKDKLIFGEAQLYVEAPSGAHIFLNGRALGVAPIERVDIYEGRYLLKVTHEGKTWSEWFDAPAGRKVEYRVRMD